MMGLVALWAAVAGAAAWACPEQSRRGVWWGRRSCLRGVFPSSRAERPLTRKSPVRGQARKRPSASRLVPVPGPPTIPGMISIGLKLLDNGESHSIEWQYPPILRSLPSQRQEIRCPSRPKLERTDYSARTGGTIISLATTNPCASSSPTRFRARASRPLAGIAAALRLWPLDSLHDAGPCWN
jgi:hypothetical protein